MSNVYPDAAEQRCWNHRMRNVLNCVGKKRQGEAKELLRKVMYAPSRKEAEAAKKVFCEWARSYQYEKAAVLLDVDWDRMIAYYAFPKEHWKHLRTTNPTESTFATIRLRHRRTKGNGTRRACLAMMFKLAQSAQRGWRLLDGAKLLPDVIQGILFKDGVRLDQAAA